MNKNSIVFIFYGLTGINGCVSTGKEANVYHATSVDGSSLAVKVL